ncbi:MAG TPA: GDSL-type esterase/lipase family protein [Opitutaceae bacterium]|nr:GDSL-type esterase/lipase family protein [Opitutaceae bacterium]
MHKLFVSVLLLLVASGAAAATPAGTAAASQPFWPVDGVFPGRGHVSSWKDFKAHNAQRRALFATHQTEDRDSLVFVGDSITEGWSTLSRDFADLHVKVVNRGIGGDTTPNLLYRLDSDVLAVRPRALVILIGTNDLGEHTSPEDIAANLRELRTRIRSAYASIPIAWCLVMPRGGGDRFPERVRQLNVLIRDVVRGDDGIVICDTYTPFAQPDGTSIPEYFKPDRLHLNAKGYAVWRRVLAPILASWNLAAEKN